MTSSRRLLRPPSRPLPEVSPSCWPIPNPLYCPPCFEPNITRRQTQPSRTYGSGGRRPGPDCRRACMPMEGKASKCRACISLVCTAVVSGEVDLVFVCCEFIQITFPCPGTVFCTGFRVVGNAAPPFSPTTVDKGSISLFILCLVACLSPMLQCYTPTPAQPSQPIVQQVNKHPHPARASLDAENLGNA
jgi:hypothetical protein